MSFIKSLSFLLLAYSPALCSQESLKVESKKNSLASRRTVQFIDNPLASDAENWDTRMRVQIDSKQLHCLTALDALKELQMTEAAQYAAVTMNLLLKPSKKDILMTMNQVKLEKYCRVAFLVVDILKVALSKGLIRDVGILLDTLVTQTKCDALGIDSDVNVLKKLHSCLKRGDSLCVILDSIKSKMSPMIVDIKKSNSEVDIKEKSQFSTPKKSLKREGIKTSSTSSKTIASIVPTLPSKTEDCVTKSTFDEIFEENDSDEEPNDFFDFSDEDDSYISRMAVKAQDIWGYPSS